MNPKPGERWRASYEGIVQSTTPSVGAFFAMQHDDDRAPEEFWQNETSWEYAKVAGTAEDEMREVLAKITRMITESRESAAESIRLDALEAILRAAAESLRLEELEALLRDES